MKTWTSRIVTITATALLAGLPMGAQALPEAGKQAAEARVEDVDGKELKLSSLRGSPVVIVYEDRDTSADNAAFKEDLSRATRDAEVKKALVVTPVADVSEYNSWPAKGFVKDAIREQSKQLGTTIWCDWDASFRSALKLEPKRSKLNEAQRKTAIEAVKRAVASKAEAA